MGTSNYQRFTEPLRFAGPGAETQTIAIDADMIALVEFVDLSAAAARSVIITSGATSVWRGFIPANDVRQLNFGKGRGSSEAGDDITVTVNGAAEIFVGVRQTRQSS